MKSVDWREVRGQAERAIWEPDLQSLPPYKRELIRFLRVSSRLGADIAEDQITLHATSLVYTSLLALVPLLAVSFSVLKGFGVHNQIEPLLLQVLSPLGERGVEVTKRIVDFVDNIKVGVLGAIGLAFLLYTVISLIQKIERAFNHIWHVTKPRDLRERFTHYFSVIVIGPVLVFAAMGITASVFGSSTVQELREFEPFGTAFSIASTLLPYLLVIAAFTFIYLFVPNTRVRLYAALTGGVVAAVLWQTVGWAFASFVASSTRYTAIYSSFAILLLFMIWVYVSWLILLVGASVAFYYQHTEFLGPLRRGFTLSPLVMEHLALRITYLVGRSHFFGEQRWTLERLAGRLRAPAEPMGTVLDVLHRAGILVRTDDSPPAYVPARDLGQLRIKEVLDAVRSQSRGKRLTRERPLPAETPVDRVMEAVDAAAETALAERTLRELVTEPDAAHGPREVREVPQRETRTG